MAAIRLEVGAQDAGARLDRFVSERAELTRARAQQLIRSGCVLVNGSVPAKCGAVLAAGDAVDVTVPQPQEYSAAPENIPLDIIYEDAALIVINKSRGMVVHPAAGHASGTLVNALMYHCGSSLSGIGGELRPGIVHRLDKETTGVMVAAKSDAAHASLSEQLKVRQAKRLYGAALLGGIAQDMFTVDKPIARHRTDRKRMAIDPDGRRAVTDVTVLERLRSATLVRCSLQTGRTHQIRVHMASLGHPVVGDEIYGPDKRAGQVMLLHAFSLSFIHPVSGERVTFTAPPPDDYTDGLRRLGWSGEPFWQPTA